MYYEVGVGPAAFDFVFQSSLPVLLYIEVGTCIALRGNVKSSRHRLAASGRPVMFYNRTKMTTLGHSSTSRKFSALVAFEHE